MTKPIPVRIRPGTKAVCKRLADGSMAVKLFLEGPRRYGVYVAEGNGWRFSGELLTLDEVQRRSPN